MRKIVTQAALALAALAFGTAPPAAHAAEDAAAEARDPSIHGRRYTSHRTPGNYAFEGPGSWHGSPRHGLEIGAHWDRTWPPHGHPGFASGSGRATRCGVRRPCANVPWPLSNLDLEVEAE